MIDPRSIGVLFEQGAVSKGLEVFVCFLVCLIFYFIFLETTIFSLMTCHCGTVNKNEWMIETQVILKHVPPHPPPPIPVC